MIRSTETKRCASTVQQQQQTLHNQSLLSFQAEQRQMFRKGEIEQIRSTILLIDDTPDSSGSLEFCKSMRRRRRQTLPTQLPVATLSKLRAWVSNPSSSMVLAQGRGIRTSSLDFAVDCLDAILDRQYPVIWALPSGDDRGQQTPSITGILRSLISQLLDLEPGVAPNAADPVHLRQFQGSTSIRHWFQLLERCIAVFPRLFIIIDTSLLQCSIDDEARDNEYFTLGEFLDSMSRIVDRRDKGLLKVVIASWRLATASSMDASDFFSEMQFATDMGRGVQRLMRQPKHRAHMRRRGQGSSRAFSFPVDEFI